MATLAQARVEFYRDDGVDITTGSSCQACTECPITFNESGGDSDAYSTQYLAYQWTVSNLCTTTTIGAFLVYDSFNQIANRFLVYANGANIYDSTCVTGSASASITIPSGTNTVQIQIYGNCNLYGPGDLWSMSLSCL